MINHHLFSVIITYSILAPVAGAITLLLTLAFEREVDLLKSENTQVKLEKELRHSEYLQLNQQIQPHFLFNSMNLLLSLARLHKYDELIKTLEHFSMFLKFKYQIKEQLITFSKEMMYTNHYLAIQKIRFGRRLHIDLNINDSIHEVLIPPYLLQTLTENAFKHGLEKKIGKATLTINFDKIEYENSVVLEVIDNGIGSSENPFKSSDANVGHGLRNIERQLNLLFNNKGIIHFQSEQQNGTKITVTWPIKYSLTKEG